MSRHPSTTMYMLIKLEQIVNCLTRYRFRLMRFNATRNNTNKRKILNIFSRRRWSFRSTVMTTAISAAGNGSRICFDDAIKCSCELPNGHVPYNSLLHNNIPARHTWDAKGNSDKLEWNQCHLAGDVKPNMDHTNEMLFDSGCLLWHGKRFTAEYVMCAFFSRVATLVQMTKRTLANQLQQD